ncbi:MAG TPA: hypothetical protein VHK88_01405, partial [Aquihabitans sp.]|nr:hypothetical protein [Aquihabitans sp.]
MARSSESSRQRRARENRARRAALEARTNGAPPARPSRVAPSTAEKLKQRSAEPRAAAGKGSEAAEVAKEGRPKRERRPRPGDRPVDLATLEGSWFSKVTQVPGGTQALFAGLMAVVVTGLLSFTSVYVSEADRDREGAGATQTIFEAYDLAVA